MKSKSFILTTLFAMTFSLMASSADASNWRRYRRGWNQYQNRTSRQFDRRYRSYNNNRNWGGNYRYSSPYRYNTGYRYGGYYPGYRNGFGYGNGRTGIWFSF